MSLRRDRVAPEQGLEEQVLSQKAFAAEKRLTTLRMLVVVVNTFIYVFVLDKAGTIPWLAYTVMGVAWVYGVYVTAAEPYRRFPILLSSYFTSISDAALIILWLHATGGFQSPFYLLLHISLVAVSFRYPVRETAIAALLYAISYGALIVSSGDLERHLGDAVVRIAYIFLAGLLGAIISSEVLQQFLSRLQLQEQLHAEERTKRREAQDAESRSAFLARASTELSQSLDFKATLSRLAELAVPMIADWCTVTFRDESQSFQRIAVVHKDPAKSPWIEQYRRCFAPAEHRAGLLQEVLESGKPAMLSEVSESQLIDAAQAPEHLEIFGNSA